MIAGWGGKPSGLRAREAAKIAGVPCLLVEDGFLRSVDRDGPPLSMSPTMWASITTRPGRRAWKP